MDLIKQELLKFIVRSRLLGLYEKDFETAYSLLVNNELGLAFDTILTQMYEYGIKIDNDFYSRIELIAKMISMNANEYSFMKELISIDD